MASARLGPGHGLRPVAGSSPGHVGTAEKAARKLKEVYDDSRLLREFLLYLAFVAVFSFVSFCSKPGVTQYYLTTEAKGIWGPVGVNQAADVWNWFESSFLSATYPQTDYNGELLDRTSRLYIMGQVCCAYLQS
jgi:hypothetical protein